MLSCYRTNSAVLENGCDCNELVAFNSRNAPDLDRVLAHHRAPLLFRRKHPNYDRRRIALIAAERNLDASETNARRWLTISHLGQFAVKHHVGVDGLISGDLKGRLRMARNEVALPNAGERMRTPVPEAVRKVVEALDEKEGSAVIRPLGDGCPRNKPEPWRTETSVNLRTSFRRETPIGGTGCTKFSARSRAV